METFEKNPPSVPEQDTEKQKVAHETVEHERVEEQKEDIFQKIAESEIQIDAAIESKTQTVVNIFGLLDGSIVEGGQNLEEHPTDSPEEIFKKHREMLAVSEERQAEDTFRLLADFNLGFRQVELWLQASQQEIESLASRKQEIESRKTDLSEEARQIEKNLFTRLLAGKKRRSVSAEITQKDGEVLQLDELLAEKERRLDEIQVELDFSFRMRLGNAMSEARGLFEDVLAKYQDLKTKLADPAVKSVMNENLITEELQPELSKLEENGEITREQAEKYLDSLRIQLSQGGRIDFNQLDPDQQVIFYKLEYSTRNMGLRDERSADRHYDTIFNFLLAQAARDHVKELTDFLGQSLDEQTQQELSEVAEDVVNPRFRGRDSEEGNVGVLNLQEVNIKELGDLEGLERWHIVKDFCQSSGLISEDVFDQTERIIIQRLFEENVFVEDRPDGSVLSKIVNFANPAALPFILKSIEEYGNSDFKSSSVYALLEILKKIDPEDVPTALHSLDESKRVFLQNLADPNSILNRFRLSEINRFALDDIGKALSDIKELERRNQRDKYAEMLEQKGVSEEEILNYYFLSGERKDLLQNLKRVAEIIDVDKNSFILEHIHDLTLYITPNFLSSLEIIDELAQELELPREDLLVYALHRFEEPPRNPMLRRVISPENGDYASFPVALARNKLNLGQEHLDILSSVYQTKTLQTGVLEREFYASGLIMLSHQEDGGPVLAELLNAYRGKKDDPRRIRKIFQRLSALSSFGEFSLIMPDQNEVNSINQEIAELESAQQQTKDKAERKQINDRIKKLNLDLQNLTGLKGIEDAVTKRTVEIVCDKLGVPSEYREKIENNLDEILQGGLIEIFTSLSSKYETKNEPEVKEILKTLAVHMLGGDFKSWRYSHEKSQKQLEGLTEEQKEFWQQNLEPITIDFEMSADQETKRGQELRAAQDIYRNAKEHVIENRPDLDFSNDGVEKLRTRIDGLLEMIKSAESNEQGQSFIQQRNLAQNELDLISAFLEIENAETTSFKQERVIALTKELLRKMGDLNVPLAELDLQQIEKIFTVGDIKSLRVYESDDPLTLLNVGVEPQETCQSWRGGMFNECLLAYVVDSNKKVINIVDDGGSVIARTILKLTKQREGQDFQSQNERKTLLVERPYSLVSSIEVYQAFARVVAEKAKGLGASVTFGKDFNAEFLEVFEQELKLIGYQKNNEQLDVFLPESLNKYEYSDTLGSKITYFDRYVAAPHVTSFEPV